VTDASLLFYCPENEGGDSLAVLDDGGLEDVDLGPHDLELGLLGLQLAAILLELHTLVVGGQDEHGEHALVAAVVPHAVAAGEIVGPVDGFLQGFLRQVFAAGYDHQPSQQLRHVVFVRLAVGQGLFPGQLPGVLADEVERRDVLSCGGQGQDQENGQK
jgi:hypothetical protein